MSTARHLLLPLLALTLGCATPRSVDLRQGMTRDEVIKTLGKKPDYTSHDGELEVLTFGYAGIRDSGGEPVGYRRKFPVYLKNGHVVAWGELRGGANPDYIIQNQVTGGQTNLNINARQ